MGLRFIREHDHVLTNNDRTTYTFRLTAEGVLVFRNNERAALCPPLRPDEARDYWSRLVGKGYFVRRP